MRRVLTLLLAIVPVYLTAGELKVTIDSLSKTCVGDQLTVYAKVEDFNASFAVHNVVTTAKIKQGATVVGSKTLTQFDLAAKEVKSVEIATEWTATATGNYTVEVTADGTDDINGPVTTTAPLVVCAPTPCPDRPTASSTIIYLGDGTAGSVTYSSEKPECCYEIKFTIVTGKDAVSSKSPETWTKIPPTANVSITVNRIKWNDQYIVGRVDWRTCDRSKTGSDYILIRDGTKPAASAPTPQTPGTTAGQTPKSGTDADPVVTSTREFVHTVQAVDAQSLSELPINLQRNYLSLLSPTVAKDNDFGPGWTHEYDWFAVRGDGEVYVHGPSGFRARFRQEGQNWILDWPQDGAYSIAIPNDSTIYFGDGNKTRVVGFDKGGRIQFVDNTFGYRNTVNYTGRWFSSITGPSGRGLTFTRDTNGLIINVTNGQYSTQYGYSPDGILNTFTNGKGNTTTYTYVPGTYYLKSWTTPEGRTPFTNEYDPDGHITRQDFGDGFTINFTNANNVTTMAYPLGITRVHKHNSQQQLTELTGTNGSRASFRYDSRGNRNQITDMEGGVLSRTFLNGMPTSATLPNGSEWDVTYKLRTYLGLPFRDIEKIELKTGLTYQFERNPNGTLKSTTQPNGQRTIYEYGTGHLPIRIKGFNFDNTYQYTLDGLPNSILTKDGTTWTYDRNVTGEITDAKKDGTSSATFVFDPNGDMTQSTSGQTIWKYTFDKDRNSITTTDPLNRNWSFVRDTRNRVIEYRNPIETSIKYNWIGPLLTSLEFAGGVRYTITPNSDGWPVNITNFQGDTWAITTNSEGIPTQFSLPGGVKWTYGSDAMGFVTDYTTPNGKTSHFVYDYFGLPKSWTTPDNVTTTTERSNDLRSGTTQVNGVSMNYESFYTSDTQQRTRITDGEGSNWTQLTDGSTNKSTYTTPSGKQITATMGGFGGATEIDWGAGVKVQYTFDGGRSSGMTDGIDSMTWKYNGGGELVKVNKDSIIRDGAGNMITANGVTASRGPGGRITGFSYDMMPVVTYRHDNRGYVNEIQDMNGGTTTVDINARGRITGFNYPGGFKLNYEWNTDDQIMKVSTSDGWWMQYVRDEYGRPTEITRSDNVPLNKPFELNAQYNADGKESSATYDGYGNYQLSSGYSVKLNYSAFGPRGFTTADGEAYTTEKDDYEFLKALKFDKTGVVRNRAQFNYLTKDPSLLGYTSQGTSWTFTGMPNGRLLYGLGNTGETKYLIDDGQGNVVAERDANGTYNAARVFTPYGVTVGKIGTPGMLGYKGLVSGLTYGESDEIVLIGRNVYNPDYGRYLNSGGIVYGLPSNTDPRKENRQTLGMYPMLTYRWDGMTRNTEEMYQSMCSFEGSSLSPRKREPLLVRFDADAWNTSEGGNRNGWSTSTKYDLQLVRDVLKIGYVGRLDEGESGSNIRIPGFSKSYDPCYGSEIGPRIIVSRILDLKRNNNSYLDLIREEAESYMEIFDLFEMLFPESQPAVTPAPTPAPQPEHQTLKTK